MARLTRSLFRNSRSINAFSTYSKSIPSKDAPSNSSDSAEIGRLFALDTSDAEGYGYPRIGIQVAIPTEYYEATRRTPAYPFVNNAFVEKGVYRTMGETVCRHFKSQGKIRDIKL